MKANYRFKDSQVEEMKHEIITFINNESEIKTAWRLRLVLEGLSYSCKSTKREKQKRQRELYLYNQLTTNDLPNFD